MADVYTNFLAPVQICIVHVVGVGLVHVFQKDRLAVKTFQQAARAMVAAVDGAS